MNKHLTAAVAVFTLATGPLLPMPAHAASRSIQVHNGTKRALVYLMASSVQGSGDKIDLLGKGIVGAGRTAVVSIDDDVDACRVNLKAVLADGEEIVRDGFDACGAKLWRIDRSRVQSRDKRSVPLATPRAQRARAGRQAMRSDEPALVRVADAQAQSSAATSRAAPAHASSCQGRGSTTPLLLRPAALQVTVGERGRWHMQLELRPSE